MNSHKGREPKWLACANLTSPTNIWFLFSEIFHKKRMNYEQTTPTSPCVTQIRCGRENRRTHPKTCAKNKKVGFFWNLVSSIWSHKPQCSLFKKQNENQPVIDKLPKEINPTILEAKNWDSRGLRCVEFKNCLRFFLHPFFGFQFFQIWNPIIGIQNHFLWIPKAVTQQFWPHF